MTSKTEQDVRETTDDDGLLDTSPVPRADYVALQRTAWARMEEIRRLRAALDRLARLGNEPHLGNSTGNIIAREALGYD